MTKLPVPNTYELLNGSEDWAIGESERIYNVQLNKIEYERLVNAISSKRNFIKTDTRPEPLRSTINLSDGLKQEQAYQHKDGFGYEVFIPEPGLVIFVDLKANGLLHLSYSDL